MTSWILHIIHRAAEHDRDLQKVIHPHLVYQGTPIEAKDAIPALHVTGRQIHTLNVGEEITGNTC